MNQHLTFRTIGLLAAFAFGLTPAMAVQKPKPPPPGALTANGNHLAAKYAATLKALRQEITQALPKIDDPQKAAFLQIYQTEAAATANERKTMQAQSKSKDGEAAAKAHTAAKQALATATENAQAPAKAVLANLEKFLTNDSLDAKLVKCVVLADATPQGLAEFAQQGAAQEALVESLLGDADLMKKMVMADGASGGKYGQAMQILNDIQQAGAKSNDDVLRRLALAVSLELAVPVPQSNPQARTDAPANVDPVKRYRHFEKAYLAGELDPRFKNLTVWEYRNAVNGNEPDEILAWGREMLRNYRPDEIATPDDRWRYVESVKTEVKYGSQEQVNDIPALQNYQNIINTHARPPSARPCHPGALYSCRLGDQPRRRLGLGHHRWQRRYRFPGHDTGQKGCHVFPGSPARPVGGHGLRREKIRRFRCCGIRFLEWCGALSAAGDHRKSQGGDPGRSRHRYRRSQRIPGKRNHHTRDRHRGR